MPCSTCGANTNPVWSPVLGETFDIITVTGAFAPGDYNQNGSVGTTTSTLASSFGTSVTAGTGADGNGNGVIDAADYVFWRNNVGASAAGITGTFTSLTSTTQPARLPVRLSK